MAPPAGERRRSHGIARCEQRGNDPHAAVYVTLEPCSTNGRTPPCTSAILAAGIRRVVVGATDPNPKHAGRGLELLRKNGVEVISGVLADRCTRVNEAFNHWIVHRVPFVTVKAGMTLDGKIATERGESKWITGPAARTWAMTLRQAADAILVGVNTVIQDDPQLVVRSPQGGLNPGGKKLRRLVLDGRARTPTAGGFLNDEFRRLTTSVWGTGPLEARPRLVTTSPGAVVAFPHPPDAIPNVSTCLGCWTGSVRNR